VPISPILRGQATYPFVRLNDAATAQRAEGLDVIDFGMGDPREPTDPATTPPAPAVRMRPGP